MSQQNQQGQQQQNQESEAQHQNPYAAYGYDPTDYYRYAQAAGYMDPTAAGQYGYGFPTAQQQQFQMPYQQQAFQQPQFQQQAFQQPVQLPYQPPVGQEPPGMLPIEQSYIENILRLNKGKLATVYMTFENNQQWNAKIFKGIIEAAGRDHLILSDPQTGMRYLLLMVYLDYVTFDEEIEYDYPYAAGFTPMATYPPR